MADEKATPNTRLAAVMLQAGVSNKGLARSVRALSEGDGGEIIRADHVAVRRWLDGSIRRPHPRTCRLIARALSEPLARTVGLTEIGYDHAEATDEGAFEYPREVKTSIVTLGTLADQELRQPSLALGLKVYPEAWNELAMRWLVDTDDETPVRPVDPRPINIIDVEAVREATSMFGNFDYKYGGGRPKPLVAKFLDAEVLPLIPHVSLGTDLGRDYFREVAALTRLAGWTAYDTGAHGLAQRYLTQAFRLAKAAGDKPLCGRILAGMSHQANFLGHYQRAVDLARSAHHGAKGYATPTTMALFYAMEARALASLGRETEVGIALANAEQMHGQSVPENDPDWIRYFDSAELHAEFAHCFRDLGKPDLAANHAAKSIEESGNMYVRSLSFCRTVLATSHILNGELEEAVDVAKGVVDTAAQLKSFRVLCYLDDFRRRLDGHSTVAFVREFHRYVDDRLPSVGRPVAA